MAEEGSLTLAPSFRASRDEVYGVLEPSLTLLFFPSLQLFDVQSRYVAGLRAGKEVEREQTVSEEIVRACLLLVRERRRQLTCISLLADLFDPALHPPLPRRDIHPEVALRRSAIALIR